MYKKGIQIKIQILTGDASRNPRLRHAVGAAAPCVVSGVSHGVQYSVCGSADGAGVRSELEVESLSKAVGSGCGSS